MCRVCGAACPLLKEISNMVTKANNYVSKVVQSKINKQSEVVSSVLQFTSATREKDANLLNQWSSQGFFFLEKEK